MILVTGATGYIGSHTCVELLGAGYDAVLLDNLSNSSASVLDAIAAICGQTPPFFRCDVRDAAALRGIFEQYPIKAVIHFAGLKAVGESVQRPLIYYDNNVGGTLALLTVMREFGVKRLIFSSSATVYGAHNQPPYTEDMPIVCSENPYGQTKIVIETMLRDLCAADPSWGVLLLRYFNPLGAHESGRLGENPAGLPTNLGPYVARVAAGVLDEVRVFGDDYPTPDGTGVRDYIHVADLARGHLAALHSLLKRPRLDVYNLGTGRGTSVLELICAFETACGKPIPYRMAPRRPGDLAIAYADVTKAQRELSWQAHCDIARMCADAWRYQQAHPPR